jgi:predicted MPP superfamily phosphohydrolase
MNPRVVVFYLVLALITGGGHLYLYFQLVQRTTTTARGRRLGAALVFLGWCALNLARPVTLHLSGPVAELAVIIAWTWFGVALYLGLTLIGFHLLRVVTERVHRARAEAPPDEERRLFLSRAAATASLGVSTLVSGWGTYRAFAPAEVSEVPVKLPRLPRALDGFTIVQITDVHVGDVIGRKFLEHVVEACNALKPDLVAITGDLVDGSVAELGPTIATLQGLRSRHGTYFITGNHEYYSGVNAWCDALPAMGITVLRNRRVAIGDAHASFDLVGVDDWGSRKWGYGHGYDLQAAIAGRDPDRAAVLLAHEPAEFEKVAKAGLGLQLSGHTHGGQMFPFTEGIKLFWPQSRGRFTSGESTMYVSRGTGFWGAPMRVDSPPEIVKVTLVA